MVQTLRLDLMQGGADQMHNYIRLPKGLLTYLACLSHQAMALGAGILMATIGILTGLSWGVEATKAVPDWWNVIRWLIVLVLMASYVSYALHINLKGYLPFWFIGCVTLMPMVGEGLTIAAIMPSEIPRTFIIGTFWGILTLAWWPMTLAYFQWTDDHDRGHDGHGPAPPTKPRPPSGGSGGSPPRRHPRPPRPDDSLVPRDPHTPSRDGTDAKVLCLV